jgi:hypothetical protein
MYKTDPAEEMLHFILTVCRVIRTQIHRRAQHKADDPIIDLGD